MSASKFKIIFRPKDLEFLTKYSVIVIFEFLFHLGWKQNFNSQLVTLNFSKLLMRWVSKNYLDGNRSTFLEHFLLPPSIFLHSSRKETTLAISTPFSHGSLCVAKGAIIFQKFFIVRRNSVITKLIGLGSCKGPFEVKKESTQMCLCEWKCFTKKFLESRAKNFKILVASLVYEMTSF